MYQSCPLEYLLLQIKVDASFCAIALVFYPQGWWGLRWGVMLNFLGLFLLCLIRVRWTNLKSFNSRTCILARWPNVYFSVFQLLSQTLPQNMKLNSEAFCPGSYWRVQPILILAIYPRSTFCKYRSLFRAAKRYIMLDLFIWYFGLCKMFRSTAKNEICRIGIFLKSIQQWITVYLNSVFNAGALMHCIFLCLLL